MSDKDRLKEAKCAIRLHSIWGNMRDRCNNPNYRAYKRYGARGICIEWNSFDDFYLDMIGSYKEGLTLDRIDNDKNYSKENCRWATWNEQARNRSNNNVIEYMGEKKTLKEWSDIIHIKSPTLSMRLGKYGWSVEKAFTTPIRQHLYGSKI